MYLGIAYSIPPYPVSASGDRVSSHPDHNTIGLQVIHNTPLYEAVCDGSRDQKRPASAPERSSGKKKILV